MNDQDLPTINQILRKADSIGREPMTQEECDAWFEFTMQENHVRRLRADPELKGC